MHAGAMEVGDPRKAVMGMRPWGSRSPEEGCHRNDAMGIYAGGGEDKEGRRWEFHLKSNNPTQSGGEKHMNGNPKPTSNCPHHSRTCYGSRGRKSPVMGMRQWGYMHARAMEVEAVRVLSWE